MARFIGAQPDAKDAAEIPLEKSEGKAVRKPRAKKAAQPAQVEKEGSE